MKRRQEKHYYTSSKEKYTKESFKSEKYTHVVGFTEDNRPIIEFVWFQEYFRKCKKELAYITGKKFRSYKKAHSYYWKMFRSGRIK